jgi:hypothetical protein
MEKGFWHKDAGYWQTVDMPSQEVLNTYPPGTKEVPLKPGEGFTYSGTDWMPPTDESIYENKAEKIRAERDRKLITEVDPIVTNPLRWASLSLEKQQELTKYRKRLLDITKQEIFPSGVVWPTKPNI